MGSWALMAKFRMLRGVFGGLVLLSVVWASQEAVHSLSDDTESKPTLSTDHISSPVEIGKELGESGARMSKNSEMDFKTQMENHHKAAKAMLESHTKQRENFKQKVGKHPGEAAHKEMIKQAQKKAEDDGPTKFEEKMKEATLTKCEGYSTALNITCKSLKEDGLKFLVTQGECKPKGKLGVNDCFKIDPKTNKSVGPSLARVNSIELITPGILTTAQAHTTGYMKKLFQMYVMQTQTKKMAKTTEDLTLCFKPKEAGKKAVKKKRAAKRSPLCPSPGSADKEEDELSEQEEAQRLGEIAGVGRRGGFDPSSGAGSFFIGASNRAGNSEALELLGEGRRGSSAFTNGADFSLAGNSNRAGNSEM